MAALRKESKESPRIRFSADIFTLIAAAFLVVAAMSFSATTAGWLSFAVSIAVVLVCGAAAMSDRRRGAARPIHGAIVVVGLWSIVSSLAFSGTALTWIVFANALVLGVLALADLVAHEITTERVVHELDVRAGERATPEQRAT